MPDSPKRRITAIYPGSFDPLTNGHLDLIARGTQLVDRLIVAVLKNSSKQPLFSSDARCAMLREACAAFGNVEIGEFDGLLVDYAAQRNASVVLRGIRNVGDYEAELQMARINRHLRPQTDTIFLLASQEYAFVSSRLIKEVITLGGDVSHFVPETVLRHLREKISGKRYIES